MGRLRSLESPAQIKASVGSGVEVIPVCNTLQVFALLRFCSHTATQQSLLTSSLTESIPT